MHHYSIKFVYFNKKYVPSFLSQWENYKLQHRGISLNSMRKNVFKFVLITNIIVFTKVVAVILFYSIWRSDIIHMTMVPFHIFFKEGIPLWAFLLQAIFQVYLFYALFQTLIYIVCLCYLLRREFKNFNKQFATSVHLRNQSIYDLKSDSIPSEIESYRQRHLELCHLTTRLDDILSVHLLFLYLFAIPMICKALMESHAGLT